MSTNSRKLSRRQFIARATTRTGQLAATALIAGCSASRPAAQIADFVDNLVFPELPSGSVSEGALVRPMLPADMAPELGGVTHSLDVQIGQMILAGFNGQYLTPSSAIIQDVATSRIGSVALFGRNIVSAAQVSQLTSALQQVSQIPLLVSVDQEGGQVRRLGSSFGLSANYSAAQLGRLNDVDTTHSYAEVTAKTLKQVGINLNLAPVVDVNVNPANPVIGAQGRSFSSDPNVVTAQALAFIQAHHQEDMLCTLKHFPGHGSSAADSHFGFVDVSETWTEDELAPFAAVIRADKCDAIMTAHIFNANLDGEHPATLSKAVVTGILRDRFGYDGVIMTDDIQMGAIRNFYEFDRAIELALDAGIDIFAISRYTPALVDRVFSTIHKLLDAGRISEERIYNSFRRVMVLKSRMYVSAPTPMAASSGGSLGLNATSSVTEETGAMGTEEPTSLPAANVVPPSVQLPQYLEALDKFRE